MENIQNNTTPENIIKEDHSQIYERVSCQYCEDAGICRYCERGKQEEKNSTNKKPDKK